MRTGVMVIFGRIQVEGDFAIATIGGRGRSLEKPERLLQGSEIDTASVLGSAILGSYSRMAGK
jgi:hypothetical protein